MSLGLHTIKPPKGSRHRHVRIGRGNASGKGTFSTRGTKGQRARSGARHGLKLRGFKQTLRRIPKMGGFQSKRARPAVITLGDLSKSFVEGAHVTPEKLLKKHLAHALRGGVKIVDKGTLAKKLTITGCAATAGARAKIEALGGSVA